ncbi:hypothetical protein BGX28_000330, partial [Mortierella sp. GBA30]
MRPNYSSFLTLLALVAVAYGQDFDREEELKMQKEIGDIICDTERNNVVGFFSCIECCQGMHPYAAVEEPNAVVRKKLTGTTAFGREAQDAMCIGDVTKYSDLFRTVVLDSKGGIKSNYLTTDGMVKFYDQKVDCFRNCRDSDSPGDKKFCIPFEPDYTERPPNPPPPPSPQWSFLDALSGAYDVPNRGNKFRDPYAENRGSK